MPKLDPHNIPAHIAIIMDGNGRWAQRHGLPRMAGHKEGVKSVQKIVSTARELGISILTLYAFSTENWNRPVLEVQALMSILKTYLKSELAKMLRNNISLRCIGQKERLPAEVRGILDQTIHQTAKNDGLILNLALSYGGRAEILHAAKKLAQACVNGELKVDGITEKLFADNLYTGGLTDPDLLIRTGGESRLSNFLLWQLSYSEIYITKIMWPDFRKDEFIDTIYDFQQRQRRFGKTPEQL